MDIKKKFGARLKEFRKAKKLSQEKLALLAGVDRTYYQKVEAGKMNISLENQEKLAKALGVELMDLFNFEEEKTN